MTDENNIAVFYRLTTLIAELKRYETLLVQATMHENAACEKCEGIMEHHYASARVARELAGKIAAEARPLFMLVLKDLYGETQTH